MSETKKLSRIIKKNSVVKIISGSHKGKQVNVSKIDRKNLLVFSESLSYAFSLGTSDDGNSKVQVKKSIPIRLSNVRIINL